jgi:hypothetical protein
VHRRAIEHERGRDASRSAKDLPHDWSEQGQFLVSRAMISVKGKKAAPASVAEFFWLILIASCANLPLLWRFATLFVLKRLMG